MTKIHTDEHALKNTGQHMASGNIEQSGSCHTTVASIGGANHDITIPLMRTGADEADCAAVNIDAVRLRVSKTKRKVLIGARLTKELKTLGPHLFNMETHAEPEKHLDLKLDLYQMENSY